jgi:hypothetical protein
LVAGLAVAALVLAVGAGRMAAGESPKRKAVPLRATKNHQIEIPRSALGKDFLLSGSIIPQYSAATSTALAGKIVRFELFHDGVDLYEATDGLVVTDDLPARRLLTTFPIVAQDGDKVVIDFNGGMRRVFTDIWYATGSGFDPGGMARALEVPQSRVFEVRADEDRLIIRQSAQARSRADDANREERYELRYFLSLYEPSEFVAKEMNPTDSRYVRYFQTQAQLEPTTGRPTAKIARFDLREPVVFYYSANTPAEYVDAVRDGIRYWNRAFGREVVRAEKAPAGVTAPDARHNVIQWVPWDNAGFAYADILVDPRTGASQRGQVYMTSVFAISGKARARQMLRALQELAAEPKEGKAKGGEPDAEDPHPAAASVFPSASVCQVDARAFARQFAAGLEALLAVGEASDAAVLRASQDYVREVIAHEVGHVLGLRHNFAGSLAATVTQKELDDWFRKYLAGEEPQATPAMLTTASVMEYAPFKAGVFVGYLMRTLEDPLPHDRAAIQWGYFDQAEAREKKMLFATDSDTGRYGDVQVFDYGTEPVLTAYTEIAELIRDLPHNVIEIFVRTKAPRDPRDRRPLAEVNLSVAAPAAALGASYNKLLVWFKAATRSLKVENAFDYAGDLNRKEVLAAHWASLTNQVDRLGGIDRAAFAFLPLDLKLEPGPEPKDLVLAEKLDVKKLTERLEKLLDAPAYQTFVGLDDKTNSFTAEEKKLILERGKAYFVELEKEVVKRACLVLEKAGRDLGVEATGAVGDDDLVAKLERRIMDLAKAVITAKDDTKRRKGKVDKSLVEVVDYKYDQETRLAAARTLADPIGSFKGWSADAKGDLNKQLKDEVDAALNIQRFKEFQDSILSRPLREWYLNQQAILALLPPKKGAEPPAAADKK